MIKYPCSEPGFEIFCGEDKYENELLIEYGLNCDVWFHVSEFSSPHFYVRCPEGYDINNLPKDIIWTCALLSKENSIQGSKQSHVAVIYTPWNNLKKEVDMDIGTIGFKNHLDVKKLSCVRNNAKLFKKLDKEKEIIVKSVKDYQEERDKYRELMQLKKKQESKAAYENEMKEKRLLEEEMRLKSYKDLTVKPDSTPKGDGTLLSCKNIEEDFM